MLLTSPDTAPRQLKLERWGLSQIINEYSTVIQYFTLLCIESFLLRLGNSLRKLDCNFLSRSNQYYFDPLSRRRLAYSAYAVIQHWVDVHGPASPDAESSQQKSDNIASTSVAVNHGQCCWPTGVEKLITCCASCARLFAGDVPAGGGVVREVRQRSHAPLHRSNENATARHVSPHQHSAGQLTLSSQLSSVQTSRVHGPCSRATNTARKHG